MALCSAAGIQQSLVETRRWAQNTELADGRRVIDQEWVQVNLARVHAKVEFLKLINWKIAWGVGKGLSPAGRVGHQGVRHRVLHRGLPAADGGLGQEAYVQDPSPGALLKGRLERSYRNTLILTFGGGTNEVQRDIIAMVGLGMPRAPR